MAERHEHSTTKIEDMMQVMGSGQLIAGTTNGVVDTETVHAHDLDRVPRGFIIISQDKAGSIYDSGAHDADELKVKCDVVTVAFLAWVF